MSILFNNTSNISNIILIALFSRLLRWDAFYFLHISEEGYIYEQEFAFFPLLPLLARILGDFGLLRWDAFYFLHISEEGYIYEQEFAFFPLLPLLARILGDFASFTRSNGIVYIGFYVYEVIKDYFNINGNNGVSNSVGGTFKIIFYYIKIILLGLISISGFIIFQTYGYYQYCTDNSLEREWCNSYLIYSFVQSYYWNCGFFKYYEFKQIPNFLLAMPMISLSVYGIFTYIKYDINRIFTLGLTKKKSVKEGK
ncbi:13631_t:CDS:2 [Entrophospora sp. SA101]|nr:13631_t:CDS:2 [Entrophospora sp. SA101]